NVGPARHQPTGNTRHDGFPAPRVSPFCPLPFEQRKTHGFIGSHQSPPHGEPRRDTGLGESPGTAVSPPSREVRNHTHPNPFHHSPCVALIYPPGEDERDFWSKHLAVDFALLLAGWRPSPRHRAARIRCR